MKASLELEIYDHKVIVTRNVRKKDTPVSGESGSLVIPAGCIGEFKFEPAGGSEE